jgi:antibiotic biosynthesis monooxygenase (ABM) superfamily enzyme
MWKSGINWLKKTFEHKGEPSSKRITLFVLVILYLVLNVLFCVHVKEVPWKYYQLILNAIMLCLFVGIATFENVIQFIQSVKGGLLKKEDDK